MLEFFQSKQACSIYIETSQLLCTLNRLTGAYMRATSVKWLGVN